MNKLKNYHACKLQIWIMFCLISILPIMQNVFLYYQSSKCHFKSDEYNIDELANV